MLQSKTSFENNLAQQNNFRTQFDKTRKIEDANYFTKSQIMRQFMHRQHQHMIAGPTHHIRSQKKLAPGKRRRVCR